MAEQQIPMLGVGSKGIVVSPQNVSLTGVVRFRSDRKS
jgi:hypothetical protein